MRVVGYTWSQPSCLLCAFFGTIDITAVLDATNEAVMQSHMVAQELVDMPTYELVTCTPTRTWQRAMRMKARPRHGGLVSSQVVEVVGVDHFDSDALASIQEE